MEVGQEEKQRQKEKEWKDKMGVEFSKQLMEHKQKLTQQRDQQLDSVLEKLSREHLELREKQRKQLTEEARLSCNQLESRVEDLTQGRDRAVEEIQEITAKMVETERELETWKTKYQCKEQKLQDVELMKLDAEARAKNSVREASEEGGKLRETVEELRRQHEKEIGKKEEVAAQLRTQIAETQDVIQSIKDQHGLAVVEVEQREKKITRQRECALHNLTQHLQAKTQQIEQLKHLLKKQREELLGSMCTSAPAVPPPPQPAQPAQPQAVSSDKARARSSATKLRPIESAGRTAQMGPQMGPRKAAGKNGVVVVGEGGNKLASRAAKKPSSTNI
eukprot:GHVS01034020.1.p1 GENE.GHVS01034020.1~~GHVS01034020.1.p1  ORF type:complete len:334 (-),score=72.82 GHVS01034020.1:279-1280(-)